jgi:hypothetical protein
VSAAIDDVGQGRWGAETSRPFPGEEGEYQQKGRQHDHAEL